MTLRLKTFLYLVFIHLVLASTAVFFLRERRIWLLAVEAFLVLSAVLGIRIFNGIFGPLQLIRTGIQFLSESDLNSRFREVGQKELDDLIQVYNQMIDHLRDERIRVQEQHHFLSQIVEASPSGIIIFDFDDRISSVNPSAEEMFKVRELAGKKLQELDGAFAEALSSVQTGTSRIIPLEGIRRVICTKSRFLDRGFQRNFLMLEELTEELRRSERAAYEKLIRMMSHEINNSVGASNSLLQSCLNYKDQLQPEDREDFEMALSVAISRAHHLNAFVRSYADIIRLPQPELRPCDVKTLLEDIAVLMRAECHEKGITWKWQIEDAVGLVPIDKNQMEQVFVNILRNSIEAIDENGVITIRMGKRSGRTFVAVEDTGRGITPEIRANLFTPFFSTKENGRGIGLTMIQEILTRHGFNFSLDGQPGRPTEFCIYF
ncbi:MAG TPA: ATP-binding protein [Bryobacteraceae bacterium]|nr:ATP-binding protein [Bryobacteraceae bacterium]